MNPATTAPTLRHTRGEGQGEGEGEPGSRRSCGPPAGVDANKLGQPLVARCHATLHVGLDHASRAARDSYAWYTWSVVFRLLHEDERPQGLAEYHASSNFSVLTIRSGALISR